MRFRPRASLHKRSVLGMVTLCDFVIQLLERHQYDTGDWPPGALGVFGANCHSHSSRARTYTTLSDTAAILPVEQSICPHPGASVDEPPGSNQHEACIPEAGHVADFIGQNLSGSRFEDVYLTDARFHDVDLTNARFHLVDLTGAMIRGAALVNVDVSGEIENLRVNGVDVVPLVEAELDRRYPDRVKMRPTDADGYRDAWSILERLWDETIARARGMAPELLYERVDDEWSFIETLRHLAFGMDAWVRRAMLGDPTPWDPLDLPHDEMPDEPSVPRDRGVRPSLDDVLALRADRVATVRQVMAELTDEQLAGMTEPVLEPGYPEPESFAVRRCLNAVLSEAWEHRLYAERDLDALEAGSRP